jgi:hypothetical protein
MKAERDHAHRLIDALGIGLGSAPGDHHRREPR